jgi:hypothetical protein
MASGTTDLPATLTPLPGPVQAIPAGVGLADAQAMLAHVMADLEGCGVELGVLDRQVLAWVAGQGPVTVAVVASLVDRALHTPVPAGGSESEVEVRGEPRPERERRQVRGLLVPADPLRESERVVLPLTGVALSDCIGGGLLDEVHHGAIGAQRFCVYADLDRAAKGLVPNIRAGELVDRLSGSDRRRGLDLRGDVLFLGATAADDDADLPEAAWAIAHACGLWPVRGGFHATVEHVRDDRAVAVIVPDLDHLAHVGCLTGTDRLSAQRYLRTPLLTVQGSQDPAGTVAEPDAYFTD